MIILDHIKIFENKIYITRNPRNFPLTLEISPSNLDKNLHSQTDVPIVSTVPAVQTVLTAHATLTVPTYQLYRRYRPYRLC